MVSACVVVAAGADVDVGRAAFLARGVVAGSLTSSEPPPHDAATRTPTTRRPAAIFMLEYCHRGRIAAQGVSPDQQDSQKSLQAVVRGCRVCRRRPRRPPDGGASPVSRGAGPATASIRHACSPLRVAAPARRHELSDPQLGTRGFGQGWYVVGLGRWSFPTPHTNRL